MAYHLEGQLLEVCTCKALCPCWVAYNGCKVNYTSYVIHRVINGFDIPYITCDDFNMVIVREFFN